MSADRREFTALLVILGNVKIAMSLQTKVAVAIARLKTVIGLVELDGVEKTGSLSARVRVRVESESEEAVRALGATT